MAVYKIERKQLIRSSMEELWAFFSSPDNLAAITPSYMNFRITSESSKHGIYAGQIITYKVSPILGIPLYWMTEITHVEHHKRFVDEQRIGPYNLWHHQHYFEATTEGVWMTDLVHYRLPFYFIGNLAHRLFLKRQLEGIFDYRYRQIESLFSKAPNNSVSLNV